MRWFVLLCVVSSLTGCATSRPEQGQPEPLPRPESPPRVAATAPSSPLGVDEASARAIANSPYIHTYEADLRLARARVDAVGDLRDPELRFTYAESEQQAPGAEAREQYRGTLRFYTENPWARGAARSGGGVMVQATAAGLLAMEQMTADQVRGYFLSIRHAREQHDHLARIVEARRIQLEQSQELVTGGVATASNLLKARLDYLRAMTGREESLGVEQRLRNEFAAVLGLDVGHALPLVLDAPIQRPDATRAWDFNTLMELAAARRHDLAAVALRAEVARWDVSAARRLRIPWFTHIQGTYAQEHPDPEEEAWAIQAAINLPLFAFRNHDVDVLRADAARFEALAEEAHESIRAEMRLAIGLVRQATEQWVRFEEHTAAIISDLRANVESDLGGTLSPDDRADLEKGVIEAERVQLNAVQQYEQALFRLSVAAGGDLPRLKKNP